MTLKSIVPATLCSLLALAFSGCLTQRTVTSGGQTTSQKIIVKRPVKGLIDNTRGGN